MSEEISDLCPLCGKEREVSNHLFLHFSFSHRVASSSCKVWHFLVHFGSLARLFEAWRFSPVNRCSSIMWKIIPFTILWLV